MRHHVYSCPACRQWRVCLSSELRQLCRECGACVECWRTDFYRLRCHIARIEAAIMDADDAPGGRIAYLARQRPERERGIYRQLWRKREQQLAAARAVLERVRS